MMNSLLFKWRLWTYRHPWLMPVVMTVAIVVALVVLLAIAEARAECLPSKQAARAAHPLEHITWAHGCFYKGYPHQRHASRRGVPASRRAAYTPRTTLAKAGAADLPVSPPSPRAATAAPVTGNPTRSLPKPYRVVHIPELDVTDEEPEDVTFDTRFRGIDANISIARTVVIQPVDTFKARWAPLTFSQGDQSELRQALERRVAR